MPLGAIAAAVRKIGAVIEMAVLGTVALGIVLGAALLVSGAVVYSSILELRTTSADTDTITADRWGLLLFPLCLTAPYFVREVCFLLDLTTGSHRIV